MQQSSRARVCMIHGWSCVVVLRADASDTRHPVLLSSTFVLLRRFAGVRRKGLAQRTQQQAKQGFGNTRATPIILAILQFGGVTA